jgi:hypothetical protein
MLQTQASLTVGRGTRWMLLAAGRGRAWEAETRWRVRGRSHTSTALRLRDHAVCFSSIYLSVNCCTIKLQTF